MTKEEKKEYDVAYRKANLDKIREYNAAYYRSHPKDGRAYSAARYWENPEKGRAVVAAYRKAHPDRVRATMAAWQKAHPAGVAAHNAKRRARIRDVEGKYTAAEVKQLLARQKCLCAACKTSIESGYHRDHVVPLALGGSNFIRNIQLLCPTCNRKKHDKHPIKFMQEMGYLI
jgi:5-methylcytosine-specific restriction endonuclease McrA